MNAFERQQARDRALEALAQGVPYLGFLGVRFERRGDELTAFLPYSDMLIGNPLIPAIHGGVTGAFLEVTALMQVAWGRVWREIEAGGDRETAITEGRFPPMPKTVDITIDYLRAGRPQDMFARATILRSGRRVANARVEAWQDEQARPIAAARGHFLHGRES